jgi:hypothetical protein
MEHWIRLPWTVERHRCEAIKAVVAQFEPGVLAGDEQMRRLAKSGERVSDRAQLDGFRARSDDERDTILAQLSPWLRRDICRRNECSWQAGS